MGSWNATCAVSNLPIRKGEAVRLIMMAQTPRLGRQGGTPGTPVYSYDAWMPISLPIRGKYDGYGQVDVADPEHWSVKAFMIILQGSVSPVEKGENPFHDLPCNEEALTDIKAAQKLISSGDGRVFVKGRGKKGAEVAYQVGYMMVREEVFQAMIESYRTISDGHKTPDAIISGAREFLETYVDLYTSGKGFDHDDLPHNSIAGIFLAQDGIFRPYGLELSLRTYIQVFVQGAKQVGLDNATVQRRLRDLVEMYVFDISMNVLSRHYAPQVGAGDETEWALHAKIAQITLDAAEEHLDE